ncbi:hypothetical protein BaRGS_00027092 [Batillaria attramentaria]|uniref:C2H2-type domain-containing protein n=1 Tax=Batillaria attramentaria TaxID=370345 RepID=A0ABD0K396_9CAEN
MGNEVSLSELMEIVTTYKCRFCAHTCPSTQEMADHVQRIHINPAAKVMEPDLEAEPESELMGGMEENQEEQCVFGTSAPIMTSLGLVPAKPNTISVDVTPSRTKIIPAQASSLPLVTTTQPAIFSLAGGTVTQNLAITAIQLTGAGLTLPTQPTAVDTVCMMDNNRELGTGPASIAPITRELFLCGICNLGFVSVEECKLHMERDDHGTTIEAPVYAGEIDSKGRVSVGTQASAKRPGRKRKSEMQKAEEPSTIKTNNWRHSRDDLTHTDDKSDADWLPGHSLSVSKRDGRSRRHIRPPKALKEDYVMVKKRRYRKQHREYKEHYTLTCTYLGCLAKFRTQTALDIHNCCHNEEDTGFMCCECQEPFHAWKALRIHLWRSHSVDVDLFQCDSCKYKTDTLHKLGVHQEIHSDSRPYTCDVCGKGFKQLSQMKNHQIIHEEHRQGGKNVNWFTSKVCHICNRVFANSKCLKKHVEAVHSKVKPYVCQYCDHTTARKAMMELHLRTHTGEKPFKCDVCPYATGDHNSLRRHKMRHTGQRQYKCQLCSYTCIQTISLKTHMRNKHPNAEGIHICPYCKFRTVNKRIYNNHMSDHRNGLIPTALKVVADVPETSSAGSRAGVSTVTSEPVQVQMQVQTMKTGEVQVSAEDLAKLSGVEGLVSGEISAAHLIYSALSVIQQGGGVKGTSQTAQLLNGIQTTVTTSSSPSDKEGVSTHTITFRLPTSTTAQPPTLTDASDQVTPSQLLTEQDTSVQGESSGPSSQDVESVEDQDSRQTLPDEAHTFEQVTQVLCAEVPKLLAAGNIVSHDNNLQVVQLKYETDGGADGVKKETSDFSTTAGSTVVVSESGGVVEDMDSVLLTEGTQAQSMVVTEAGQLVEGVVVVATGGEQAVNAGDDGSAVNVSSVKTESERTVDSDQGQTPQTSNSGEERDEHTAQDEISDSADSQG